MNFLSSIDPNVAAILITAITGVVGWVIKKARGEKSDDLWSTLKGIVDNAIHDAGVAAASRVDDIRVLVVSYAWRAATALKIPRNATTEAIVNQLVEVAIADAIQVAKDHDKAIAVNVAALQASAANMAKFVAQLPALAAAAPKLLDGMQVTTVTTEADFQAASKAALAAEAASKLPSVPTTAAVIGVTK